MQEEVIDSVLQGHDTLALMPTGGGKSITFQVPAMMCEGVAIVITPLVALMKDQVDQLRHQRIRAAYLHSGQKRSEMLNILDNVLLSDYKLLYVSPERLNNKLFLRRLHALRVSFVVVDECHCISQWGYDFRPDYLRIKDFRKILPTHTPILALTATATIEVVEDVQQLLTFRAGHKFFKRSFYRPALSYVVRPTADKLRETVHILRSVPGSALVYLQSRKKTYEWANFLNEMGLQADYFHAGLPPEVKAQKQEAWQSGATRIMVCTNAFGMGINKRDVRVVIHPTAPLAPESYYQEAGRAGRDNHRSYAVLLYTPETDERILLRKLENKYPPRDLILRVYDALGNYFQLGVELGEGALFEFNVFHFCGVFHFPVQVVLSALAILSISGYVEYLEDHSMASRLKFIVPRNELYHLFADDERHYDDLIELLLRQYPGLFSDYSYIDEGQLAKALGYTPEQLSTLLKNLRRWHIIDYIPGKRSNYILYKMQRQPTHKLKFPAHLYKDRVKGDKKRLGAMLDYIHTRSGCRVELLMKYFGEEHPLPCGYCDLCLSGIEGNKLTYRLVDEIEAYLKEHNIQRVDELTRAFPQLSQNDIITALDHLERERRL